MRLAELFESLHKNVFRVGNLRAEENLASSLLNNALSIISTKKFNDLLNSVTKRSLPRRIYLTVSRVENFNVYAYDEIKRNIKKKNTTNHSCIRVYREYSVIKLKIVRSSTFFLFFLLIIYQSLATFSK